MPKPSLHHGLSTLVNHAYEGQDPLHAHVAPIYQTSTFSIPDVATGASIFSGEASGYIYTRTDNPNLDQLARKYALLEGLDLLRQRPDADQDDLVRGRVYASGMDAISAAVLGRVSIGETIIAQRSIYSGAFVLLNELAPRLGINVVWVKDVSPEGWESAFHAHPEAVMAYAESPANPVMTVVDLAMVADLAHQNNCWLMVDNTFATPYCQRPLTLGADVVLHSTTKFLSGHGLIIGGAMVTTHPEFVTQTMKLMTTSTGGSPSPFDAWLANVGLRTFELRMQRHCANGAQVARYLDGHPKTAQVFFPGLETHPRHQIAKRQMHDFGAMISFELKGGFDAGAKLMDSLRLITLAVSLGNVDSLIQHPASMTHAPVPPDERLRAGITDGLVRLSVGIENVEDILADLEQALANV